MSTVGVEPARQPSAIPGVAALRGKMRGAVLEPGDSGYDEARTIWNGMVDRRPALIVQCAGVADVVSAVTFARERNLVVSVKSGGHGVAGTAVCDGGMTIDLSRMKGIEVDPVRRTAVVGPGVTWAEFDRETQVHGLATTGGIVPTTGVAGLTLGGGLGFLMRRFGLASDNLIAADAVASNGSVIRASADEHPDLFWGLRGGSGNFGIVTSLEFQLHAVGPTVLAGFIFHPWEQAREVARFYREFTAQAPDELAVYLVFATSPEGTPVAVFLTCYSGEVAEGERVLAPLRSFGQPLADTVGPVAYTEAQAFCEPLYPKGRLNYWKSSFLTGLSDDAIERMIERYVSTPSPSSAIAIEHLGGAIGRLPDDATAFGDRSAPYSVIITGAWTDSAESDRNLRWVRDVWSALTPYTRATVYVNYVDGDETGRMQAAYGRNYQRLTALKAKYDPDNFFRHNHNIKPQS